MDFIQECFQSVNLPATVLLILILLYWLSVIFGVLGMDAFDLDMDADMDVDVDGDIDVGAGHGVFYGILHFFHLGELPVMVLASFWVLFFWVTTMVSNHYFNADWSLLISLYCFIPNLLISLILTKLSIMPLVPLFKKFAPEDSSAKSIIGKVGLVSTSELDAKFGQVTIQQNGPPIVINARTASGQRLQKNDAVKVVSYAAESGTYFVEIHKLEKE